VSARARFLVFSLLIVVAAVVAGVAHAGSTVIAVVVGATFVLAASVELIVHRRERQTNVAGTLSAHDRRRIALVNGSLAALQIAWGLVGSGSSWHFVLAAAFAIIAVWYARPRAMTRD
jgi:hypothetical protein